MQPKHIYSRPAAVIFSPVHSAGHPVLGVELEEVVLAGFGKPCSDLFVFLASKSLVGLVRPAVGSHWLGGGVEQDTDFASAKPSPWKSPTRK